MIYGTSEEVAENSLASEVLKGHGFQPCRKPLERYAARLKPRPFKAAVCQFGVFPQHGAVPLQT